MANKINPFARRKARRFVLQALYQKILSGLAAAEIESQFLEDNDMRKTDTEYFHELLIGIERETARLDEFLDPILDRSVDELDPIEHGILHIGAFELIHRVDVPYKVVINEAVELSKTFGATDAYKLVNSVLDALSQDHRTLELGAR